GTLPFVLIRRTAGLKISFCSSHDIRAILRHRSGVALAVDDIEHGTIRANADGTRVPAGGNQALQFASAGASYALTLLGKLNYGYRIGAAIGYVQEFAVPPTRQHSSGCFP